MASEPLLGDWRFINGQDGPIEVWDGERWEANGNREYVIQKPRVIASAIVDLTGIGLLESIPNSYSVTVWGDYADSGRPFACGPEDATHKRVYAVSAKSDTLAAQEGISRFVAELSG